MDLNSLTPEDHARRYALLVSISLGCFIFLLCWMGVQWNVALAALAGIVSAGVLFFPLRALMRLIFR